jgi:hypothetical protein
VEPPASPVAANRADQTDFAGEIVDALDGLCLLAKRSSTLDGSAPVKAVQFCTPFVQGNSAGIHLLFADSVLVRWTGSRLALGFAEQMEPKTAGPDYESRVAGLVERGLLIKNGYWHRKLAKRAHWGQAGTLHLWTGFLIRPARDRWLLITGAFNRRCSIDVREHVIPDTGAFVPLVVTLELASVRKRDTWLEKEVACIVPLHPDVRFETSALVDAPELGRRYVDHFDQRWETSAPGHYVGAYRKMTVNESSEAPGGMAACRLVIAGGPSIHRVRTFDRFSTASGWSKDFPGKDRLQFVDVRNIFHVEGRWDGDALRDLVGETPEALEELRAAWAALYGERGVSALNRFLVGYVRSTHGPRIGEPYLTFTPWAFVSTPPGWSTLIDGAHFPGIDGMRGVISTDKYHTLFEVWQFNEAVRFKIPRGATLLRALPVPRRLLQAGLRTMTLDEYRPADGRAERAARA